MSGGTVVKWRPEQPEPEPTEAAQRCQCGHDQFRLAAYNTVLCGKCGEVQGATWGREAK